MTDTPTPAALDDEALKRLEALLEKRAPVQGYSPGIPWSMHLRAYAAYCKKWSPQPALIEGWCRGGFGTNELDEFIPGWREQVALAPHLSAPDLEDLRALLAAYRALRSPPPREGRTDGQVRKRPGDDELVSSLAYTVSGLSSFVEVAGDRTQEIATAICWIALGYFREYFSSLAAAPPPSPPEPAGRLEQSAATSDQSVSAPQGGAGAAVSPSTDPDRAALVEDWRTAINVERNRDDLVMLGDRLAAALSNPAKEG